VARASSRPCAAADETARQSRLGAVGLALAHRKKTDSQSITCIFHPDGDVKMAQVVPASNRERANNILWWRTREDYNYEDPTGRKWTDLDWIDDGNMWASRRDEARIIYGSPPGLMILSVSKNRSMHVRFVELDQRSRRLVEGGETDPFALTEHPLSSRSTMNCQLRPGWLQ
jgi:hypothetical protein